MEKNRLKREDQFRHPALPKGSVVKVPRLEVGDGTGFSGPPKIKGGRACSIGKYCGIGEDLRIITSDHSTTFPNLNVMLQRRITGHSGHTSKGPVRIGHNVWIGDRVTVLSGITIGNGAVLAACSVVTRDVPAYTIVAGNPAKALRPRFSAEKAKFLDELRWWHWSPKKMAAHADFFASDFEATPLEELQKLVAPDDAST
ncbi:CatB-related O-acetyltransferase [Shimia sp.]|uniref:CatB-related O-acetyltransferase n=1 Tax=Shimia sp. TaxID=1954381 RepID=UPI0032989905